MGQERVVQREVDGEGVGRGGGGDGLEGEKV